MVAVENSDTKGKRPPGTSVIALCVDLVGSTTAGMRIATQRLDWFNLSLMEQLRDHLRALELKNILIKCTGDGWLLMTDDEENTPAFCILARIMAERFQLEMASKTGMSADRVPWPRVAIGAGRDIRVKLPDGSQDWLGDSARRATRVCQLCKQSEVLVCEQIRSHVFRDFRFGPFDVAARLKEPGFEKVKWEEDFPVWRLGLPVEEAFAGWERPHWLVYGLSQLGRVRVAARLGKAYANAWLTTARVGGARKLADLLPNLNRLMSAASDYATAAAVFRSMQSAGCRADVVSYSILVAKAPDYETAKGWLDKMAEDGIPPDVVTYNTLIAKAPDYETAKGWLDKMAEDGIPPDVVSYTGLFRKDLSSIRAERLLTWYLRSAYHPEQALQAAIAQYRVKHLLDDALHLALNYPHLPAARKVLRENGEEAVRRFQEMRRRNPTDANASYALGIVLTELGRTEEAAPVMRDALRLASGKRAVMIEKWLATYQTGHGV